MTKVIQTGLVHIKAYRIFSLVVSTVAVFSCGVPGNNNPDGEELTTSASRTTAVLDHPKTYLSAYINYDGTAACQPTAQHAGEGPVLLQVNNQTYRRDFTYEINDSFHLNAFERFLDLTGIFTFYEDQLTLSATRETLASALPQLRDCESRCDGVGGCCRRPPPPGEDDAAWQDVYVGIDSSSYYCVVNYRRVANYPEFGSNQPRITPLVDYLFPNSKMTAGSPRTCRRYVDNNGVAIPLVNASGGDRTVSPEEMESTIDRWAATWERFKEEYSEASGSDGFLKGAETALRKGKETLDGNCYFTLDKRELPGEKLRNSPLIGEFPELARERGFRRGVIYRMNSNEGTLSSIKFPLSPDVTRKHPAFTQSAQKAGFTSASGGSAIPNIQNPQNTSASNICKMTNVSIVDSCSGAGGQPCCATVKELLENENVDVPSDALETAASKKYITFAELGKKRVKFSIKPSCTSYAQLCTRSANTNANLENSGDTQPMPTGNGVCNLGWHPTHAHWSATCDPSTCHYCMNYSEFEKLSSRKFMSETLSELPPPSARGGGMKACLMIDRRSSRGICDQAIGN